MAPENKTRRKPAIVMTRSDHERLTRLAEASAERNAAVADQLFAELDRARLVADDQIKPDIVRMGTSLRFTTDAGEDRTVTLVFPGEADIAEGKVSILTPIGAALIGLAAGQSINWAGRDGRAHRLTVEHVDQSGVIAAAALAEELRPTP